MNPRSIKKLRERLMQYGRATQTDAELIGVILNSKEAADAILKGVDYDLKELGRLNVQDLLKHQGVGEAKAAVLVAALEIGRRRMCAPINERPKITCSEDVYLYMQSVMLDLPHEEFWILTLNRSNQILCKQKISQGGVSGTIADPKIIFNKALAHLASAVILAHNHPSGNKQPSQADIALTKKLKKAGDLLEIPVLDHIIFTDDGYFSFNDDGMI